MFDTKELGESKMEGFVHLHTHTEYSLLDGACRIDRLLARAAELGMKAMAITDHGNMYGVVKFYKAAKKYGIKPLLGCEVYTAPRSRFEKEGRQDSEPGHLVLIAKDKQGYKNLMKIVSAGFTEGFYYKPRIDMELLREHSEGLVALSACLAGDVSRSILNGNMDKAREYIEKYIDIFGKDDFYIELQDHGLPEQKQVNIHLINFAGEYGLKMVATNDIHYVNKSDSEMHDALLCIQTGKTVDDEQRMRFATEEFYVKSEEEMASLFPNIPSCITNTAEIAEKCNVELEFGNYHLPKFEVPDGFTPYEYLRSLCESGLKERYGEANGEIKSRLDYELETINKMGYVDYFLIVWDFIKYAKDNGIVVGPGRGSAAGSVVSYCLKITDIDPIKYNLLFERFLNPERISMPDIDVDFCIERRQEVIDYVIRKYGKDNVAQIITFGTFGAKQAIRDSARVLSMPYADADRIAKLIPQELDMTIEKAISMNRELKELYENDAAAAKVIDIAKAIEGMPRHSSTHAAGVVICGEPVSDYVPLSHNGEMAITQFEKDTVEELGLLKMDFLGLRNLTIIRDTLDMIKRDTGETVDLVNIDYDIPGVYKMISEGDTDGVFQLESAGMKNFMKELKPQNLEDIIAGISLFRPGPMDEIPTYVDNKSHPENVRYKHEKLKPILDVTYGCMVYQEQIMQIVRDLAGYSFGRADLVRRAMSKKKMDVMEKERDFFINGIVDENGTVELDGAVRRGVDKKTANDIFDGMIDFAKYAFNKSHAACYAVVAYETAYLKYKYPTFFMAALLSSVLSTTDKVTQYIMDCGKMGISLLPPSINESIDGFSVDEHSIRFGLAGIANVGFNLVDVIVKERERGGKFTSFDDFANRMQVRELNKRAVECMIKAGAMDCFGKSRAALLDGYADVLEGLANSKRNNLEGQGSLLSFLNDEEDIPKDSIPDKEEFPLLKLLAMEKEMMGIYISGHPMQEYKELAEKAGVDYTNDISDEESKIRDGDTVTVAGMISARKDKLTKNNTYMSYISVEDMYGSIEVLVFPKIFEKARNVLGADEPVCVKGRVDIKEDYPPKIIADSVLLLSDVEAVSAPAEEKMKLYIKLKLGKDFLLDRVMEIIGKYKGNVPLCLYFEESGRAYNANRENFIEPTQELLNELVGLLGEDCIKLTKTE